MVIVGAITHATIQLDLNEAATQLADRDSLLLVIRGNTTGAQAASVTWRRNNDIVNSSTRPAGGGSFFVGGGDTIVGTGPCESRMYGAAIGVFGRLPGNYTYTVSNANTPNPVTSPLFEVQGMTLNINNLYLQM